MRVLTIGYESISGGASLAALCGPMVDVVATDGEGASRIARESEFDAILMAVNRSSQSADLVQMVRLAKVRTPILLVAQPDRLVEVVRALSAGADDYLTLPIETDEIVKRLFQISRDHSARVRPVLRLGKLKIDLERRILSANGERIHLTGKEFQILELLVTRRGTTVTKGQFLDHLYGGSYEPVMKIIDVFVCKLRKKIMAACNESYIETIWGRGYIMRDPEAETGDIRQRLTA